MGRILQNIGLSEVRYAGLADAAVLLYGFCFGRGALPLPAIREEAPNEPPHAERGQSHTVRKAKPVLSNLSALAQKRLHQLRAVAKISFFQERKRFG